MPDDAPPSGVKGVVRLDSRQLIAARRLLSALADHIEAQRHAVTIGTPIPLPMLADGGPTQRAALWLEEQVAGLQSLADLEHRPEDVPAEVADA